MPVKRGAWCVALVLCTLAHVLPVLGKPWSIPPSQFWEGVDGPWSTFRAEVGNPPQQLRLLPAHDQSSTWTILSEACPANDNECADSRGRIFRRDNSTTWQRFGTYDTNPVLEQRVGLEALGLFGWDDITLGWVGDNMPTMKNQSVVGITSNDFWIGSLPLNPRPINFTNYNNPIPSLMENLFNHTDDPIPSLSWSYTAGAFNLAPKVLGSLVLGGYDTTRFQPNSLSFPFGQDISLDFQVAIQSITSSLDSGSLLGSGTGNAIIAYISTMVADIWLPMSVCQNFERAFGLTWDSNAERYLLNASLHQTLLERDPSVRFTIGPETSGGGVTITMPYWNFYHTAKLNATSSSSGQLYFPIKRAANDSQYVLGRTFLQSAHLSVDYHRRTFNLSQALYPSSSTESRIVALNPPRGQNSSETGGGDETSSGGLGTGAIAGIAVGSAAVIVALVAVAFLMYRRRQKKAPTTTKNELPDQNHLHHEVSGNNLKVEADNNFTHEAAGDTAFSPGFNGYGKDKRLAEADGDAYRTHEMLGDTRTRAEVSGDYRALAELDAVHLAELPGDDGKPAKMLADTPPTDYKQNPKSRGL
ncbi:acid protease [Periconia macrospinosa]|uniref:Acid protease n=1 Tax=Periconia macrospinosa TaxID=97972 RepID=A0A2V1DI64_9PLEO|nr:acid protease [Periconia macrospinosa]